VSARKAEPGRHGPGKVCAAPGGRAAVPDRPVTLRSAGTHPHSLTALGTPGAVLALLSLREREEATRLAARARHIELASRPDFQMRFMETMLFPTE